MEANFNIQTNLIFSKAKGIIINNDFIRQKKDEAFSVSSFNIIFYSQNYLVSNNSLYLVRVHVSSSTNNSNLSQ